MKLQRIISALILALPTASEAHEIWFVDPRAADLPARPEIFSQPTATGIYLSFAAAIALIALFVFNHWYRTSHAMRRLERAILFRYHARQILAAMLGVSFLGLAISNQLFAPNHPLPPDGFGLALKVVEIILGILFIFGEYFVFHASVALIALFIVFVILGGPNVIAQDLHILASAIFLAATAPCVPFRKTFSLETRRRAYSAFRILLAVNFLALTSMKWLYPELALSLVQQHHLNFLAPLGIGDDVFVFCMALVEETCAIALLFNLWVRPIAMLLLPLFTLTVFIFGTQELFGHLPIAAALGVLIVYGHHYRSQYASHLDHAPATSQAFDKLPV